MYAASLDHFEAEKKFNKGHQIGYLSLINLKFQFIKKLKKLYFFQQHKFIKVIVENINNSEIFEKCIFFISYRLKIFLNFSLKNSVKTICLRISNGYGTYF